ncbi:probable beta-1,4-xylosyltransferase IRX9H isoform X2 [Macadamia integrifolia]|uniref:probable beta-1,4-xylosyltransferase IRX9H isoform X2 n=1 Tax=Macadamia integrifolia TaxID=60698 RepID=UPI001C4FF8B9|nr:probable beta-1,4-xylosyltransferase IRX9H isoform X2 [Macadamia integrifolia]XP_042492461.1 probable beta-1,4-xylosyltransferase IRX9H isoform X2 [Macadamia integrifolia]XP_042492462.1 probable beta-1,4-xylosyltransferase IRX9H isoform X2 [Macadamia integrifolia]
MASIRRTFSPVPHAGAMQNGEVLSVASPLPKSSSSPGYSSLGGSLSAESVSVDSCSVLYRLQAALLSILSRRYRPSERSRAKGQLWRRAFVHFFICFMVGLFIGLTPFISMNVSINLGSKQQAFSFEVIAPDGNAHQHEGTSNKGPHVEARRFKDNASLETRAVKPELLLEISDDKLDAQIPFHDSDLMYRKLLIIVTPTYARPLQAYYLNRLAQTLRLVPPPLLWIVVEMFSQSAETADILRKTGVMYRHLVCYKNLTSVRDRRVHQRNVALSHIETHHLDGIVYHADDDTVHSINLFEKMREIRRFGTWPVALLTASGSKAGLEGPVCNDSQVIGWHTNRRNRRFQSEISGFAFNSTILWDPKRWNRSNLEPIRQLDTVKKEVQESMFIEQVVEDESQMEGLGKDCSRIMVWHLHLEASHPFYPYGWFMKKNLDTVAPLI